MITRLKSLSRNQILTGSTSLAFGQIVFNATGYITTILMSRTLTVADFGVLAVLSSFFFLMGIPAGALGLTIQRYTAYLSGRDPHRYQSIRRFTFRLALTTAVVFNVLYIIAIPWLQWFFRLDSALPLIWFAPAIGSSFALFWFKDFLKGHLAFLPEAILVIIEGMVKLAVIAATFWFGWGLLGAIAAFWVSITSALVASWIYVEKHHKLTTKVLPISSTDRQEILHFLGHSALSQLGLMVLISVDIILVKHLVSPEVAGQYGLLSIFGKIIFLGATSLTAAIVPMVAKAAGTPQALQKSLIGYALLGSFTLGITGFFSLFAPLAAAIVVGDKADLVAPILPLYSLAIGLVTLGLYTIQINLQLQRLLFAFIPNIFALVLGVLLASDTSSLSGVVSRYLWVAGAFSLTSLIGFFLVEIRDWYQKTKQFLDLEPTSDTKLKILIYNWRDLLHVWAGGAEVYVHELGKRFVKQGHQVVLFCGNDKKSAHLDEIDGIKVIRCGGFYSVYLWAAIYYLSFFRNKFDVLIDCENGIPFFTPFYSRIKKFLVVHHVHQEVFSNHLPWALAKFAQFLEGTLMPWVYSTVPLITVSESSRAELIANQIAQDECNLVHAGIDLKSFKPGKKSRIPMVLYVGRLKPYKSVDVLIRAAQIITNQIKTIRFIIAGTGEDRDRLQALVDQLNLNEYFIFKGKVTQKERNQLYRQAWVVVNPSFLEGFGITSIEANASGSVMVASDVPGLRDSVKDGYTGILVPYGDVAAFAEAISFLVNNHETRNQMEGYALSWSKRYSWDKSSQKFLNLINRSLKQTNLMQSEPSTSFWWYVQEIPVAALRLIIGLFRPAFVRLTISQNWRAS